MMHIAAIFRQKCLLVIHCCGLQRVETEDSFTIAAGKAGKADKGDAWAAPALQTLYALRHMMTADSLTKLLPAWLRLQGDIQGRPACLPACLPTLHTAQQQRLLQQTCLCIDLYLGEHPFLLQFQQYNYCSDDVQTACPSLIAPLT